MSKQGVKLRAQAMRFADILSRADIPGLTKVEDRGRRVRTFIEVPTFPLWPDINIDPMISWDEEHELAVDDGAAPAVWPIRHAFAMSFTEPGEWNEGGHRVVSCRTISAKEVRGVARRISTHNCLLQSVTFDPYGRVIETGNGYFGRFNRSWVNLTTGGNYVSGGEGAHTSVAPAISIGEALERRYEWAAVFTFPTGVSLRVGTSARGVLALFRDREKDEGYERRRALVHWVRRYWKAKTLDADEIEARRYLRGVTTFVWRGLKVAVQPSDYEMERTFSR